MKPFARVIVGVSIAVMAAQCRVKGPARPDATACAIDADCTFGLGVDADDCCPNTNGPGAGAQSVAFSKWARARSESPACAGMKCAPVASPMPPPPGCASQPRCRQGRCGTAC